VRDQVEVNTIAPLALFQATLPLLKKSSKPIFLAMSSGAGSMGLMEHYPMLSASYGASKAALNYVMKKLHFEHPDVIVFPLSPGKIVVEVCSMRALS
jgi:norsolorinic acid ketoreductase